MFVPVESHIDLRVAYEHAHARERAQRILSGSIEGRLATRTRAVAHRAAARTRTPRARAGAEMTSASADTDASRAVASGESIPASM